MYIYVQRMHVILLFIFRNISYNYVKCFNMKSFALRNIHRCPEYSTGNHVLGMDKFT